MGKISSKGVEERWIELGDEITMATRTSAVRSARGMWEGSFMLKWSKVEGIAPHFFFSAVLGDSHGRDPNTHCNELFTHTHARHTHHYITDNDSYITRPRGHRGYYNALTSVPTGQINKILRNSCSLTALTKM